MHKFDMPPVKTPFSTVGYLTYKRTYARKITDDPEETITEEFPDTILRVINSCETQLHCGFTEYEEYRLAEYMLSLKLVLLVVFSGSLAHQLLVGLGWHHYRTVLSPLSIVLSVLSVGLWICYA